MGDEFGWFWRFGVEGAYTTWWFWALALFVSVVSAYDEYKTKMVQAVHHNKEFTLGSVVLSFLGSGFLVCIVPVAWPLMAAFLALGLGISLTTTVGIAAEEKFQKRISAKREEVRIAQYRDSLSRDPTGDISHPPNPPEEGGLSCT
jgi:hypothetical protein